MRRLATVIALAMQAGLASHGAAQDALPKAGVESGSRDSPSSDELLFTKLPVVEAATLHAQTLEEAPASVTIVTAADIRKFGYHTLREALASVRGFYFTNDRLYDYSGVRGLAIPGDYNSRFLVMLNGHPLTENIYNSNNFFGQDFGLDMDLVERIEIIRGPSSALYGSNGMLANINVVTKSPVDVPKFRASVEAGSFGERKAQLSSSLDLGHGANLLLSTSVFNYGGRSLYYPEYDTPENDNGMAHRVEAQKGYHTFANLVWGRWNFTGYFNSCEKLVPVGGGGSIFDSHGARERDSRNFAGVNYTRELGSSSKLHWRMHYDQYRYDDRWDYPIEGDLVEDNRTWAWGDWLSSQMDVSVPVAKAGTLTMGVQGTLEFRSRQLNADVSPEPGVILDINTPDRMGAIFAQQEWNLGRDWTAYFGLRFDHSKNFGNFASPRLALVYHPSGPTSYKLVYGRPFRNPSSFERYYDDGLSYAANPLLARETAQAFEVSVERKLHESLRALVNAYYYQLSGVIQGQWISDELMQYWNSGARRSTGIEFEVWGKPVWWLEAGGSFVLQRASDADFGHSLPNAPRRLGKAQAAVPLLRNKVYLSAAFQYLSPRTTVGGAWVRPVELADITLSTIRLFRGYDVVVGLRNALNWQYDQPVDLSVDRIRANGRTFFVKLIWRDRE
jgi:outer membrane receptor for ferrienterochelin and colicins